LHFYTKNGALFGSEDNNTVERKTYARFTTALPLSDHESMTSFSVSKKAFQNSDIVNANAKACH
jgi:hypothetical protein